MSKPIVFPKAILLLIFFALPSGGTEYVFEILEFPGADFTVPQGINNDGLVAGFYAVEIDQEPATFGFVWEAGEFESPDFGLFDAIFNGVNDSAVVVGTGLDFNSFSTPVFTASLNTGPAAVETFDVPDAFFPLPGGINNSGDFVGSFFADDDTFASFGRVGDEVEVIEIPGLSEIGATDINNAGQIVGGALDETGKGVGFILTDGEVSYVNHPDGDTELLAINDVGSIAGSVFGEDTSRTFIYDGNTFEDFAFPEADDTVIWGMNDHGVVVGQYFLGDDEVGFIATPIPEPNAGMLLLFGMVLTIGQTRRQRDRI